MYQIKFLLLWNLWPQSTTYPDKEKDGAEYQLQASPHPVEVCSYSQYSMGSTYPIWYSTYNIGMGQYLYSTWELNILHRGFFSLCNRAFLHYWFCVPSTSNNSSSYLLIYFSFKRYTAKFTCFQAHTIFIIIFKTLYFINLGNKRRC